MAAFWQSTAAGLWPARHFLRVLSCLAYVVCLKRMRVMALLAPLIFACAGCGVGVRQERTEKVLFVGNSLTYAGNLPAVFSALAAENGRFVEVDMIVQGGATLSQRAADGSIVRALTGRRYAWLVLQERGGDLMCSFGRDSCIQSREAIRNMVAFARKQGTKVALLGTYQQHPAASEELVEKEASAAADAGIPYIEVSAKLQRLQHAGNALVLYAPDGVHPGKDLTLLYAMLVYQAFYGSLPNRPPRVVSAPIYGSSSGLDEVLRRADAPPPQPDTPREVLYGPDALERLLDYAGYEGGE